MYLTWGGEEFSKMFLDIVGIMTTSKLSILKTFQVGGLPHMSNRVKELTQPDQLNLISFALTFTFTNVTIKMSVSDLLEL